MVNHDLSIDQGAAKVVNITLLELDGTPRDFTGVTFKMQVRKSYGSTAVVLIEKSTENGSITAPQMAGKMSIYFFPEDTSSMMIKTDSVDYVYDLYMYNGLDTERICGGTFTITAEVTF